MGSSEKDDVPALVSVVVPVYNCSKYLAACLDSILTQTYSSLEVIVVDDASTDDSADVAEEFARRDPRVRVERQPANAGQFPNVNAGLALARGEYVAVYHADDVYHTEIIEREVRFLDTHPETGAVYALVAFIDENGHEVGRLDRVPPEIESAEVLDYPVVLNALLRHMWTFLPTPTALVRRKAYVEAGLYRSDYGLRGDLDMWLRIARRRPVGLLRAHLASYRFGHDNESSRYGRLRVDSDLTFRVVDAALAAGDLALAEAEALATYEGHRAADLLLAAGNAYILGRRRRVVEILGRVQIARIVRSRRMRRSRLVALFALLHALARLPHSRTVARRFWRHWHASPTAGSERSTPPQLDDVGLPVSPA